MEVILFSMKGCPYCDDLKNKLEEKKIRFVERDVDEHEILYESFLLIVSLEKIICFRLGKIFFTSSDIFSTPGPLKTNLQLPLMFLLHSLFKSVLNPQ